MTEAITQEQKVYEKHLNLKIAANELNMKWQTLYAKLKKLGVPVVGDKTVYGSEKDRLAAKAEMEFGKLVPEAQNQNKVKFQSTIDFMVGNHKIDVKSSRLNQVSKKFEPKRWAFSVKKQEFFADFIVCFAFLDDYYRVFLIPGELVRNYQTISISPTGNGKWLDYEVQPSELRQFFKDLD